MLAPGSTAAPPLKLSVQRCEQAKCWATQYVEKELAVSVNYMTEGSSEEREGRQKERWSIVLMP